MMHAVFCVITKTVGTYYRAVVNNYPVAYGSFFPNRDIRVNKAVISYFSLITNPNPGVNYAPVADFNAVLYDDVWADSHITAERYVFT